MRAVGELHLICIVFSSAAVLGSGNKNWGSADLENPTKSLNESRHNRKANHIFFFAKSCALLWETSWNINNINIQILASEYWITYNLIRCTEHDTSSIQNQNSTKYCRETLHIFQVSACFNPAVNHLHKYCHFVQSFKN